METQKVKADEVEISVAETKTSRKWSIAVGGRNFDLGWNEVYARVLAADITNLWQDKTAASPTPQWTEEDLRLIEKRKSTLYRDEKPC